MNIQIHNDKWICEFSDKEMKEVYDCVDSIDHADAGPVPPSTERESLISSVEGLLKQCRGLEPWDWGLRTEKRKAE